MSKSMGFRNSGKLDLGGKNIEYIVAGVLLVIIVVAVVLAVGPIRCGSDSIGKSPGESRIKCVKCGEEGVIDPKKLSFYYREMEMRRDGAPVGMDCDKCGEKKCVFLMTRCPKCKKYFLPERITDPDAFAEGGSKEICPDCGTDLNKWYKEHRRRR